MRRNDRQVLDVNEAYSLIKEEEVMRLAFTDDEGVYIVPVNYGSIIRDNEISLYIHGACEGRKAKALKLSEQKNTTITFEIDGRHEAVKSDSCDASYYYMSVVGKASVEILDGEDKVEALNCLMNHIMPATEYHYQSAVLPRTMVCKLKVQEWTCKQHSK